MTRQVRRRGPGNYEVTVDGEAVTLLYTWTDWGDRGWRFYLRGDASDVYQTKRDAVATLVRTVKSLRKAC